MKESSTYQAILEEGRAEERFKVSHSLRDAILRLGTRRCGPPSEELRQHIAAINEIDRLEEIYERLADSETWDAILLLLESND